MKFGKKPQATINWEEGLQYVKFPDADRMRIGDPTRGYLRAPPPPDAPESSTTRTLTGASTRTLNRTQRQSTPESQQQSAKRGDPYPLIYGYAPAAAMVLTAGIHPTDGNLVLVIGWCGGESEEIVFVSENNKAPDARIQFTHYRGNPSDPNYGQVDPWAAAAIDGYADTLIATLGGVTVPITHTVAKIPRGASDGFPKFVGHIKGRKVYDPRDVGQDPDDSTTWLFSTNVALCSGHFYSDKAYGMGRAINWSSVGDAADDCEALMAGEPSHELNLILKSIERPDDWLETVLAYGGLSIARRGAEGVMRHRKSETPARVISDVYPGNTIGSIRISERDTTQDPTVLCVEYTHIPTEEGEEWNWRTESVGVERGGVATGAEPYRKTTISMPGFHSRTIAKRFATARLNEYASDLLLEWEGGDDAWRDELGDVVEINAQRAPATIQARIIEAEQTDQGRYQFLASEDGPQLYSDVIATDIPNAPPGVGNPLDLPAVTGVAGTEEVYQAADGTFQNRIRVTWDAALYSWPHQYRVQVLCDNTILWDIVADAGGELSAATGTLTKAKTYDLRVQVFTELAAGAWGLSQVTTVGKFLVPGPPPGLNGFSINGEVRLNWQPGADSDVLHYKVSYKQITGGDPDPQPAGATVFDELESLRLTTRAIPEGTWRFWVYAVDSVQQESDPPASVDVVVSQANDAYILDQLPITFDPNASKNCALIYRDRAQTQWETYVETNELATDKFSGNDVGGDYPNPCGSYSTPDVVVEDPSFDNGLTDYPTTQNATIDTGGDGSRLKLTCSGSSAYARSNFHTVVDGARYVIRITRQQVSGDPLESITVKYAGANRDADVQGTIDNGDGTIDFYGVDTAEGTSLQFGIHADATDGSEGYYDDFQVYLIIDFFSAVLDVGADATGTFRSTLQYQALSGTPEPGLIVTKDGGGTTVFENTTAIKTTGRYLTNFLRCQPTERFVITQNAGDLVVDVTSARRTGTVTSDRDYGWLYVAGEAHEAATANEIDITGDMTMAAIIRPDVMAVSNPMDIMGKPYTASGMGTLYISGANAGSGLSSLVWRGGNGTNYDDIRTDTFLQVGATYSVAVRRDATAGTVELWVDGVLEKGPQVYSYTPAADAVNKFRVGDINGFDTEGPILDACIWNKVVPDDDLIAYMLHLTHYSTNCQGRWRLANGSGVDLDDFTANNHDLFGIAGMVTNRVEYFGRPAWTEIAEQFSAVKSFSFAPLSANPASFGVPKIQFLTGKFRFAVMGYLDGEHVEQQATYQVELV